MVAASSYQKDGRPAPARLTATASSPTITGSHAAGVRAGRRPLAQETLTGPPRTSRRYGARTDPGAGHTLTRLFERMIDK